ncbi:Inward rectifier potassium channel transmembrane domain-containing protein [Phytophthora infestans]|uniref:Inward rectifier potassium channel transmembrane domain-containing protein n=1 Tax=Phytophthora infestans TaxID=4787 RepID=A0A833SV26_PHYIN|nr:Inward rectifier potassium channel transmembrane domain-containing protein [Phytophthora infestans]
MSGVEQPLLSVASSNGAGSFQTQSTQRTRFLDRRGRFKRSLGRFNVYRKGGDWRKIYWDDPFHTVINTRTSRIIWGVFIAYFFIILFFAVAYLDVSVRHPTCHVGLSSIMDAYIFSLETIMTIGYGAPTDDIFYGGCTSIATLLTLESFSGIILDSVCIGIFYARFSRANQRANTIMFSNSAVIRKIRGHFYFMFQTCERRKHQRGGPRPTVVVHRIDQWSPLFRPSVCRTMMEIFQDLRELPDPTQRQVDIDNGSRDGETSRASKLYKEPTKMQIMNHIRRGIDSSTSNTMQARNSYTDEDIMGCIRVKTSRKGSLHRL